MGTKAYEGSELETFAKAVNWKKYYVSFLKPYIKGHVLEVGAGIGGTTVFMCDGSQTSWICLEPDDKLSKQITQKIKKKQLPGCCKLFTGMLSDMPKKRQFDSILYIDVIEHIENDSKELQLAVKYLKPKGFLIIVVPAHQWLYSPFDKSIGHYRRYNKKMLKSVIPAGLEQKKLIYLDSAGLLASSSNKILKQDYPTERQVLFWDRVIVSISKFTDKIFRYLLGKEVIGIWQKV